MSHVGHSHTPVSDQAQVRSEALNPDPYSRLSWGSPSQASLMEQPISGCVAKGAFSFLAGYPMGLFFAFLMPPTEILTPEMENARLREKIWHSWKQSTKHGLQNGRLFARMGLLWTTSECSIELIRAKSDPYNGMIGGCITGILLGTAGGPSGMGLGCLGFASMAVVFEKIMHLAMSGSH